MRRMRKRELEKVWRQLDQACEALERLSEHNIPIGLVQFDDVVSLKNKVEVLIESKTRKVNA